MQTIIRLNRLVPIIILALLSGSLLSQVKTQNNQVVPEEGMEGKNVPWITTPQPLVDKMLKLAKITPKDFLIDLGSGDGRTVISAARLGTRALGIEYNPELVKLSKKNAEKEGVSGMTQFIVGDIFESDFSKASVITMFLLPEINMRLRSKLLNMKPGTRIVTNTFTFQDWQYDETAKTADDKTRWNTAYLWIVPAKVNGKWNLATGGELIFEQEFQLLSGSLKTGGKTLSLRGRLRGNEITFNAGGIVYTGSVAGTKMEGTCITDGKSEKWSATR